MDLGIAGKTAIVTAASKGLGFGCAAALAAEGANVVFTGRGADALARAEADLKGLGGGGVLAVQGDITKADEPARVAQAARDAFGAIDIVVANAGGPPAARALDVTDEQLLDAFNANCLTSIRLAREGIASMRERGWGRVCFVTSFSVPQPIPLLSLSNTARTALYAWAKTAAQDVADEGITINVACPGTHDTERSRGVGLPAGRLGDARDFGRVVAFLCSAPANYVNGAAVVVDGGATLAL